MAVRMYCYLKASLFTSIRYPPQLIWTLDQRVEGGCHYYSLRMHGPELMLMHDVSSTSAMNCNVVHVHSLTFSSLSSSSLSHKTQEEMNGSLDWSLVSQETDLSILFSLLAQYFSTPDVDITGSLVCIYWVYWARTLRYMFWNYFQKNWEYVNV